MNLTSCDCSDLLGWRGEEDVAPDDAERAATYLQMWEEIRTGEVRVDAAQTVVRNKRAGIFGMVRGVRIK